MSSSAPVPVVVERAHAKINLALEILGKRPDGYHDIATIMQLVELHDTLEFRPAREITLVCDSPQLVEDGDENLVLRAARMLQRAAGTSHGAAITLTKRVPLAAGLGGGSSDGAATLRGLSSLWNLSLPVPQLDSIGAQLGSDVPFFLHEPAALAEGLGERLTALPGIEGWVLLVCPPATVQSKTARLYSGLQASDFTSGEHIRALASALRRREFPEDGVLRNSFEGPARRAFDGLPELKKRAEELGGRRFHLSGSGPTLFALWPPNAESAARHAAESLGSLSVPLFLTRLLS